MRAASRIAGMGWSDLVGQGLEEAGIDAFEDDAREALGDALFVAAARRQCCLKKRGSRSWTSYEGGAAKEQVEGAEGVLVVGLEKGRGGRLRRRLWRGGGFSGRRAARRRRW